MGLKVWGSLTLLLIFLWVGSPRWFELLPKCESRSFFDLFLTRRFFFLGFEYLFVSRVGLEFAGTKRGWDLLWLSEK